VARSEALTIAVSSSARVEQIPRSPVAILAKRDKKMMDEEIRQGLEKSRLNIETRTGDPSQALDLQKVPSNHALQTFILN
jgi:hypothetical protein